jgi:hypothetical protein
MSITPNLMFHLKEINEPNKSWENIEFVFGKHNIIRAHQLENQIMNLSPYDFYCIEYYLSKFKTLRLLFDRMCQHKDLKKSRCIYIVLSKLGSASSCVCIYLLCH